MDKLVTVCEECGSRDVQYRAWVHANTDTVEGMDSNDAEDYWCNCCGMHVYLIDEKEFNKNK